MLVQYNGIIDPIEINYGLEEELEYSLEENRELICLIHKDMRNFLDLLEIKDIAVKYNIGSNNLTRVERHFLVYYSKEKGLMMYKLEDMTFFALPELTDIQKIQWGIPSSAMPIEQNNNKLYK